MAGKFFTTLRDLRAGETLSELDGAIAEVVSAVKATGKAGEVILKIKVRPPKKSSGVYLTVEDDVTVKVPKQDRADTIFFPTADNGLSRQDPSQMPLALKSVPREVVDTQTGEIHTA